MLALMVGRRALVAAIALGTLLGATSSAGADTATAEAAYKAAKELVAKGDYANACPLFEASYKADPALGAQLNMADCHEHVGKTATAWAEFDDAASKAQRANDARAGYARGRADALLPKLARLTVRAPKPAPPGLAITRDGTDVTALVGVATPVDPGAHVLAAAAPGYQPWTQTVPVAASQQLAVDVGELAKAPEVGDGSGRAGEPVRTTAAVTITTQVDAAVAVDGKPVGTGKTIAELARGPHTLRVTAAGMRAFQQEIYVGGGDDRTIDVQLEREVVVVTEEPYGPRFEAAASAAPGVKLHADDPAMLVYRLQIGVHLRRYGTLFVFAELGSLSAGDACGTDIPGAQPGSPFDFGPRNQFQSCRLYMGGLEFDIRFARRGARFQPWLGIGEGLRDTTVKYEPTSTSGVRGMSIDQDLPGLVTSLRLGVDIHPAAWPAYLTLGAFVDFEITDFGQEAPNSQNNGQNASYLSFLGGLRSTVAF
jgi:hypothetical protein